MTDHDTFACCLFGGGESKLALPVEHVLWVHDDDRIAPHICDILEIERQNLEVRVLELETAEGDQLFLSVDLPIGVQDFDVASVLPRSAQQSGKCAQAIIDRDGELTLLLDGQKISQELRTICASREAKD